MVGTTLPWPVTVATTPDCVPNAWTIAAVDIGLDAAAEQMRPLAADLDQRGLVGAGVERCVERIEGDGGIGITLHPLPQLPDLDRGGDLVARRQPADPPGAAVDAIILRGGFAVERHCAEARVVTAAVAHLLVRRQDRADVEERPRRSPVGEIIAQREGADRRAVTL